MAKYSKKKANQICTLIRSDSYTIAEICVKVGISESCFYNWQANNVEFGEKLEKARDDRMKFFAAEAKKSLLKKIQGYEVDETKTVYEPIDKTNPATQPRIRERTIIKKHIQPDTAAVIFTLCNAEPENFKNRQNTELTGKDGKDLFAKLPDEDLDKRITELERKLGK